MFLSAGLAAVFAVLILAVVPSYDLREIKSRDTGDGQHGSARWATPRELRESYRAVPEGKEAAPGIVVGREGKSWLLDTSDKSLLLMAPPGGGKTTRSLAATIIYNALANKNTAGKGAGMIFTDLKGELIRLFGGLLAECGYHICYLNLRDPFHSYYFKESLIKSTCADWRINFGCRSQKSAGILHVFQDFLAKTAEVYTDKMHAGIYSGVP